MTRPVAPRLMFLVATALCALGVQRAAPPQADPESAYRANNVGISFLEQFDYDKAATAFEQSLKANPALGIAQFNRALALFYANNPDGALEQARSAAALLPDSPHVHYLLGLLARSQNRSADAIAEFQRVLQRDPDDVGTKVNLGQVYVEERSYDAAVTLFREALAAEPYNVTAAYNLATALTRSGAQDEGRTAMARFQTLRDSAYGNTYAQTYLAQGKYAEALASTGAEPELVDPAAPAVSFVDATSAMLPGPGQGGAAPAGADAAGSVTLIDVDDDGDLDLVTAGAAGLALYRNSRGVFTASADAVATQTDGGGSPTAALAADYDNDGRPDLLVLRQGGHRLLHQQADGRFTDVTAAARLPPASQPHRSAAFADLDHDGDVDLFIAGHHGAGAAASVPASAGNLLLRNNGDGTFTDITAAAGVGGIAAPGIAVVPTDFDNRRDMDLLVVQRGRAPALFQNVRDGSFRDAAEDARLPGAAAYTAVAAGDVNKDGFPDFFFGAADTAGVLATSDGSGRFTTTTAPAGTSGATAAQFVDYDNDGLLDLFVLRERAAHLVRNLGGRWTDVAAPSLTSAGATFQSMAIGDLDADGDQDAVVRLADGALRAWRNDGGNTRRSLQVRLAGRVSNRGGVGAKIDLRAGSLRQRLESSAAVPAVAPADLRFGLGTRTGADAVRVLWPSGTLQAEVDTGAVADTGKALAAGTVLAVTELDRKPSSCPFLYTWNGTRFEFVTDFMGGGELGYWAGPGQWNQPDPDEYVRIGAGQLQPRDGRYELRVTNELEETTFIDRLQLIAVDHSNAVEVYPNEGLKSEPPPFALTTVRKPGPVAAAVDDAGRDVREQLAAIDRKYADGFGLTAIRGYAEPHTLTLDLGVDGHQAVLLMTGWTDYAFSGDNVAASQSGRTLSPPSLQVKDASGAWRTAIAEIGIPVGRPQTVVVDLRGRVPRHTRIVRIATNMRVYWDQVLVDASGTTAAAVVTRLDAAVATLAWRGFSAQVSPDGREPYGYDYARVATLSPWKQMTGRYTRQGDVRPLLDQIDDLFVVSRPGDEITLAFDAARLPTLPAGSRRTFLLYVDGYSKEMNINSATPDSVLPMPFHGMSKYPYGPDEHYPRSPAHEKYLSEYNTRVVARGY